MGEMVLPFRSHLYIDYIVDPNVAHSHLCHNSTCAEPSHIIRESGSANSARYACMSRFARGGITRTSVRRKCPHTPKSYPARSARREEVLATRVRYYQPIPPYNLSNSVLECYARSRRLVCHHLPCLQQKLHIVSERKWKETLSRYSLRLTHRQRHKRTHRSKPSLSSFHHQYHENLYRSPPFSLSSITDSLLTSLTLLHLFFCPTTNTLRNWLSLIHKLIPSPLTQICPRSVHIICAADSAVPAAFYFGRPLIQISSMLICTGFWRTPIPFFKSSSSSMGTSSLPANPPSSNTSCYFLRPYFFAFFSASSKRLMSRSSVLMASAWSSRSEALSTKSLMGTRAKLSSFFSAAATTARSPPATPALAVFADRVGVLVESSVVGAREEEVEEVLL